MCAALASGLAHCTGPTNKVCARSLLTPLLQDQQAHTADAQALLQRGQPAPVAAHPFSKLRSNR